jgi:RNA polymerase-binding transcription factor DksA
MATTKKSTKTSPTGRKTAAAPAKKTSAHKPTKSSPNATKRGPAKKSVAPTRQAPAKKKAATPTKQAAARKTAASTKQAAAKKSVAPSKPAAATAAGAATTDAAAGESDVVPAPRGRTKDGIAYTRDFDAKFLKTQRDLLTAERQSLLGQADRLEDEANSLIEDGEMGDVQFDDESGEGDTMVVERERDLALSAQARQTVTDIDAALDRLTSGTYGYSLVSGRPIPRERLEAIPWATELVEEKVGGIGRR